MGDKPEVTQADDLRNLGWSVAVHNDYRINGEQHTFWLWTHPDGWWVKGEGRSDCEAITACAEMARHRTSQSESDAVRELVVALERFALIKAEDGDDFSTLPPEVIVRCEIIAEDLHIARAALTRYRGEGS